MKRFVEAIGFEWLIVWAVVGVCIALVAFALTDDSPSCEERGGKEEFTHFLPIFTGKTTVLVPQYDCIGAAS